MASSKTRQRKLARAKLDRQLARRAERERRGRQIKAAGFGLAALLVIAAVGAYKFGVFDSTSATTAADQCSWNPLDATNNSDLKEVGTPEANGLPDSGTATMTIALGSGTVTADLDRSLAPCAAASLNYLADQGFYNGTKCHELTHSDGDYALACGDPSGTGNGGAAYGWFPENVPNQVVPSASASDAATASPAPSGSATPARYPKGTVAMLPSVNGSQFRIFYQDSTVNDVNYSIVGHVTSGLDVLEKIAQAGTVQNDLGVDTKPAKDVTIQTLSVVSAPTGNTSTVAPSTEPSSSTSTTPSPSAPAQS